MSAGMAPFILHVRALSGAGGGPIRGTVAELGCLASFGYEGAGAVLYPRTEAFESIAELGRAAGVRLIPVATRGPLDTAPILRLAGLCRAEGVEVWHAHGYKEAVLGLLVRRLHPMKLVTQLHGWIPRSRKMRLYYAIERQCLRYYDHVFCVSPALHERALRAGLPQQRVSLVPNAVDAAAYTPRRGVEEAKAAWGLDPGVPAFGTLARLAPVKRLDLLVAAAARLLDEGERFTLVIAGEGASRRELASQIDESGHADRIRLLGFVQRPVTLLEALDGFVLSSEREGLPNAVLEAMAAGVPVLATRVGGLPELIIDDVNGMLVEPGSVEALVAGLRALLWAPEEGRRVGSAGRDTVVSRFSIRARAASITTVYDRLIRDAPGVPHG